MTSWISDHTFTRQTQNYANVCIQIEIRTMRLITLSPWFAKEFVHPCSYWFFWWINDSYFKTVLIHFLSFGQRVVIKAFVNLFGTSDKSWGRHQLVYNKKNINCLPHFWSRLKYHTFVFVVVIVINTLC